MSRSSVRGALRYGRSRPNCSSIVWQSAQQLPRGQRRIDLHDAVEIVVATGVDRRGAIEARFREHGDRALLGKTHDCVFQGLTRIAEIRAEAQISYRHDISPTTVVRRLHAERSASVVVRAVAAPRCRRAFGCARRPPFRHPVCGFLRHCCAAVAFLGARSFPPCESSASRAATSPSMKSVHHCPTDTSSSPDSQRNRRKS